MAGQNGGEHTKEEHEHEDPIKKWKRLKAHSKKLVDTTERHHRVAYDTAVEKHLLDEKGLVDYEKLDEDEIQKKFADTMADFYIEKATKYFEVKKEKLDEFDKELLLNAYAGTTRTGLRLLTTQLGKGFKFDDERVVKLREKWMEQINAALSSATESHVEDKDIEGIIKYAKLDEFIDPEHVQREQALQWLKNYDAAGALSPHKIAEDLHRKGLKYLLTEKGKEYLTKKNEEKKKAA